METRHDREHTTERLTEGLRCPWKWGHGHESVSHGQLDRGPMGKNERRRGNERRETDERQEKRYERREGKMER